MRWTRFIDGNANGGLNLESLLAAQERVTEAEREYVNTLLIYNLAAINLKRATGTLLISEDVQVRRACKDNCGPSLEIEKVGPGGGQGGGGDASSVISASGTQSLPFEIQHGVPVSAIETDGTNSIRVGNVMQLEGAQEVIANSDTRYWANSQR